MISKPEITSQGVAAIVLGLLVITSIGAAAVSTPQYSMELQDPDSYTHTEEGATSQLPGVSLNQSIDFENGENYVFKIHDEQTGGTLTLTPPTNVTIPAGEVILLSAPQHGNVSDGGFLVPGHTDFLEAPISVSGEMSTNGLTNLSVSLINSSTEEVIASAGPKPYVLGYGPSVTQTNTSDGVEVTLQPDGLPTTSQVSLIAYPEDSYWYESNDTARINMTYDETRGAFVGTIDSGTLGGGAYKLYVQAALPTGTDLFTNIEDEVVNVANESNSDSGSSSPVTATAGELEISTKNVTASPNSTVTVPVNVTNTGSSSLGASLNFTASPQGWEITSFQTDGAVMSGQTLLWTNIEPGATKQAAITIAVPANASGEYTVSARARPSTNSSLTGDVTATVTAQEQVSVSKAIAGTDGQVSTPEILEAVNYWQNGETIPNTGGETLTTQEILTLVQHWQQGSTISG